MSNARLAASRNFAEALDVASCSFGEAAPSVTHMLAADAGTQGSTQSMMPSPAIAIALTTNPPWVSKSAVFGEVRAEPGRPDGTAPGIPT